MKRRTSGPTSQAIDWLEVHRRGWQGSAYVTARLAGTLSDEARGGSEAAAIVHLALNTPEGHQQYAERRRAAERIRHLVPFR